MIGGDLLECGGDGGIGWSGSDGLAGGEGLLRVNEGAAGQQNAGEGRGCEEAREDWAYGRGERSDHEIFSLCKTVVPGQSYA